MAEIRVEQKRGGGSKWLWIVLALVLLAALAYWFLVVNGASVDRTNDATVAPTTGFVLEQSLQVAMTSWRSAVLA
jgi:bacteriorhodopsin